MISIIMFVAVSKVGDFLGSAPVIVTLLVQILFGIVFYTMSFAVVDRNSFRNLIYMLGTVFKKEKQKEGV